MALVPFKNLLRFLQKKCSKHFKIDQKDLSEVAKFVSHDGTFLVQVSVPNATNAAATSCGETSGFNRFHHIFDQLHGAQLTRVVLYKDTATGQGTLSTLMQVTGFSIVSFFEKMVLEF